MTPEEFLEFQYGINIKEDIDEKKLIHPLFLKTVMEEYAKHVLLSKIMDETAKDADEAIRKYRLEVLEDVKFGFDICSDMSTNCLGYRNLCDRIRREIENKPIDKSIKAAEPFTDNDE
jgi:hypothetical protein